MVRDQNELGARWRGSTRGALSLGHEYAAENETHACGFSRPESRKVLRDVGELGGMLMSSALDARRRMHTTKSILLVKQTRKRKL